MVDQSLFYKIDIRMVDQSLFCKTDIRMVDHCFAGDSFYDADIEVFDQCFAGKSFAPLHQNPGQRRGFKLKKREHILTQ